MFQFTLIAHYMGEEERPPWELSPMPRPRVPKNKFTSNPSYSGSCDSTVGLFLDPSHGANSVGGSSLTSGLVDNAAYSFTQSQSSLNFSDWSGSIDSQTPLVGSENFEQSSGVPSGNIHSITGFREVPCPSRPPPALPKNKRRISMYVNPNYVPSNFGNIELTTYDSCNQSSPVSHKVLSDCVHGQQETSFASSDSEDVSSTEPPCPVEKIYTIFEEDEG